MGRNQRPSKKNILYAADFLFPEFLGGSARFASELANGLISRGHYLRVITRKTGGAYSGKVIQRKYKINYNNEFFQLIAAIFCRYDYVISHHFSMALFMSIIFRKKKLIYVFHGPVAEEYELETGKKGTGYYLRQLIENFVLWRSNKIVVISEYAKKRMLKVFQKKAFNLGPLHSFNINGRRRNRDIIKRLKLLTVRRLTQRTGVRELCQLVELSNNLELTVIGKGELLKPLQASQFKNTRFLGSVSDNKLRCAYKTHDLFVLPSIALEGFGLVVLEALASGIPVLVSKTSGGAAEFFEKIDPEMLYEYDCDIDTFLSKIEYVFTVYKKPSVQNIVTDLLEESQAPEYARKFEREILNVL